MIAPPADALALIALALPLYTRIRPDVALEHATRERIVAQLRGAPGSTRRELVEALCVPAPTLAHHLEILQALRLVRARREGREVAYALEGARAVPRALRAPARAELARLLREAPRTQNELAALTGTSQRLVAYHLRKMAPFVEADGARPRRYSMRPGEAAPVQS